MKTPAYDTSRRSRRSWTAPLSTAALSTLAFGGPCLAQTYPFPYTIIHGQDTSLATPQLANPAADRFVLPNLPELKKDLQVPGVQDVAFYVDDIKLTTALISQAELDKLKKPYLHRNITASDAVTLRDGLTAMIVSHGYINSGVVIPDQNVSNGVLKFEVIEGRLVPGGVVTSAPAGAKDGYLTHAYTEHRLGISDGRTLNVKRLNASYQSLLNDRNIERVSAELRPGKQPGEAVLDIDIVEKPRRALTAFLQNDRSPAVGELRAGIVGTYRTAWRPGDQVDGELGMTQALADGRLNYSVPLTAGNIMLDVGVSGSTGHIIETPLNNLDATSRSLAASAGLTVPVLMGPGQSLRFQASVDRVHVRTELLGKGFSFSPGAVDGVTDYSSLRSSIAYSFFSSGRAMALSVFVARGLDGPAIGADRDAGHYWSCSVAGQYVQRLSETSGKLIVRGQLQLSGSTLYATEKLALGGASTVRGYRQNLLLGDRGAFVGAEYQWALPQLLKRVSDRDWPLADKMQVSVFADMGHVADTHQLTGAKQTLSSAGVRLVWPITQRVSLDAYYAQGFNKIRAPQTLSDNGWGIAVRRSF